VLVSERSGGRVDVDHGHGKILLGASGRRASSIPKS
jgi:hypothetical protein